jgi:hypothetical protein
MDSLRSIHKVLRRHRALDRVSRTTSAVISSVIAEMDLSTISNGSVSVVLGTVKGVDGVGYGRREEGGIRMLYTDYLLSVEQAIIFNPSYSFDGITVRNLGGTDRGFTLEAPEEPSFTPDERVLVFLSKDTGGLFSLDDRAFTVNGGFQGKYTIVRAEGVDRAYRRYDPYGHDLNQLITEIQRIYKPDLGAGPTGPGRPAPA